MPESKREISGFFLSVEKFASHVAALASADCVTAHLRLFHNEPQHTAAIVDALGRNTSVTSLDIFELDAASAASLSDVLSASSRLTSLAVHHPHGHDAVVNLCRGIAASRTLTSLHLSHLDARGMAALAAALVSWDAAPTPPAHGPSSGPSSRPSSRLLHLRLAKCVFNVEVAVALAEAVGLHAASLAHLELVESELGDTAAEAMLAAPGWAALRDRAAVLTSLDLSSCHMGPRGACQLGTFLAASTSLQSLILANNKAIGCQGAAALATGLAANRTLCRLDLSGCGVGAPGVRALAAALRPADAPGSGNGGGGGGGAPLQQLSLGSNAAGAVGLAALLGVMSGTRPCGLRKLELDHNHVKGVELEEALRAVAAPLMSKVTAPLEQLSLAGNALYDVGVAAVATCLTEAPCLEHLDLRENGISDGGVTALLPLVAPRGGGGGGGGSRSGGGAGPAPAAGLQGLLLDGNRLHNAGAQALLAAVTAAPGLWRFSADGNKLTDPALRLSLTQLSQHRAARHSQLAVLGRYYSSSSSSSSESEDGSGGGEHRGSGGGGGGGHGGDDPRRSHEVSSAMDVDAAAAAAAPQLGPAAGAGSGGFATQAQPSPHHKHRLEEAELCGEGGCDGPAPPSRNVAPRGWDGAEHGGGGGGGGVCGGGGSGSMAVPRQRGSEHLPCMPRADGEPRGSASVSAGFTSRRSRDRSSGGGSSGEMGSTAGDVPMLGVANCGGGGGGGIAAGATHYAAGAYGGGGGAGISLCTSPPPVVCFVTAMTGVGGAGSVGVSKRVGASADSDHPQPAAAAARAEVMPQQVLPACRRPRYKPLTPEQQRLFEDF